MTIWFANCRENCWKRGMRYPRFSPRTKTSAVLSMCLALTASSTLVRAGQEIDDKAGKEMTTAAEPQYEGGRGLLTLQGPSGMFINPTSGTLPCDDGSRPSIWHDKKSAQ